MSTTTSTGTTGSSGRPLSPHLTAYKWGPHMLVVVLLIVIGKSRW